MIRKQNPIAKRLRTGVRYLCISILWALLLNTVVLNVYRWARYRVLASVDGKTVQQKGLHSVLGAPVVKDGKLKFPPYEIKNAPQQDVIVVIADSGLDINNPAFKPFLWVNPWEVENGKDDDGNGCVDDIHGCSFGVLGKDGDIQDTPYGHGTLVTSVIAGVQHNSIKLSKTDSRIHFVVAKCMPSKHFAPTCPATVDYAIWLRKKTGWPVAVNYSLSWLVDPFGVWEKAVYRARAADVVIIASAGNRNGGYMTYPAILSLEYDNVISVAALGGGDEFAEFSSKYADIGAYGYIPPHTEFNSGEKEIHGTSISAPYVTQVVALLLQQEPEAPPWRIRRQLFAGSDKVAELEGVIKEGRVLNAKWTLDSVFTEPRLASR